MTDREQLDEANITIADLKEQIVVLHEQVGNLKGEVSELKDLIIELRSVILELHENQGQILSGLERMRKTVVRMGS